MSSEIHSVEALFKLAGDTADLMVASSKSAIPPQSLHNQLDIPDRSFATRKDVALRRTECSKSRQSNPVELQAKTSASSAISPSHLSELPVKKKRGRPPKVRPPQVIEPATELTAVEPKPAVSAPEAVFAHRSQLPPKRIHFTSSQNPVPEATTDKTAGGTRR
jgi:hypothetical protein